MGRPAAIFKNRQAVPNYHFFQDFTILQLLTLEFESKFNSKLFSKQNTNIHSDRGQLYRISQHGKWKRWSNFLPMSEMNYSEERKQPHSWVLSDYLMFCYLVHNSVRSEINNNW